MELPLRYSRQQLLHTDILDLPDEFDNQVGLIVTSPPYNLDIHYGRYQDNKSYQDYLDWCQRWMERLHRLAKPHCRFCLNVPLDTNLGGPKPIMSDLVEVAQRVGWNYRSTIIWDESNISRRTAWGSYASSSAPNVIAPVEVVVLLHKGDWHKGVGESDISPVEFKKWSLGLWKFNGESAKRVGHPAPFPLELPRRCIRLFSYVGDIVLDPFLGSGTTLIAAEALGRVGIGCDVDAEHIKTAMYRLQREWQNQQRNWSEEVRQWLDEDAKGRKQNLLRDYLERKTEGLETDPQMG